MVERVPHQYGACFVVFWQYHIKLTLRLRNIAWWPRGTIRLIQIILSLKYLLQFSVELQFEKKLQMDSSQSVIVNFLSALEMFQKCVSYQRIVKKLSDFSELLVI